MMDGTGMMETGHTRSFLFSEHFFVPVPREVIPTESPDCIPSLKSFNKNLSCWNAFQRSHRGQFKSTKAAAAAYRNLKENQSPWPIGFDQNKHIRTMMPGEQFHMIVGENREDMPGRFGTIDHIENREYGRQRLAIKKSWIYRWASSVEIPYFIR